MPVTRCAYTTKRGRCQSPAKGDPPLCAKHKKLYKPPSPWVGLVDAVLQQPVAQGILGKLDQTLNKANQVVDRVAGGDFSDLDGLLNKLGKPKVHYPSPEPPKEDPRVVLGFSPDEQLSVELIKKRRKDFAKILHSDKGGNDASMARINAAVDELLKGFK